MGFPKDIREKALVASGRRCCICTRFKSINIEVHHIIQEADGGANDFENAIPLCLDCHANAGHYNSRHPKGTKYQPSELRKHRDKHYEFIEKHRIRNDNSSISQFYLKTSNLDVMNELFDGDFSQIPYEGAYLIENNVLKYMKYYHKLATSEDRSKIPNPRYDSVVDYKNKYGNKIHSYEKWGQMFLSRIVDESEIRSVISPHCAIAKEIIAYNAPELIKADFSEWGCGADTNYETYSIPDVAFVFIAIQNNSSENISLSKYGELIPGERISSFIGTGDIKTVNLPNIEITPGCLILIPVGLCLNELSYSSHSELAVEIHSVRSGESQFIDFCDDVITEKGLFIGEIAFIQNFSIVNMSLERTYTTRSPLFSQAIRIDRSWECGSCPHLFAIKDENEIEYLGELFDRGPGIKHEFNIRIENNFNKLVICELEAEITYLDHISINGKETQARKLNKGERLELTVTKGDHILIRGFYHLLDGVRYVKNDHTKSQRIQRELASIQT